MQALHELWVYTGYVLVGVFGCLALWRGGWAERSATLIIWFAWAINPFLQNGYDPGFATVLADSIVSCLLIGIAHFSRRYWTVFAAASALGALMCHVASGLAQHIGYFAYLTVLGLLGGIYVALALAAGVIENEILRRRNPPV